MHGEVKSGITILFLLSPYLSPHFFPFSFPLLRLFHLTTVDFNTELSHIVHSSITQVDRPIIRALPKYRNRAGTDNAFNILAVSLNTNRGKSIRRFTLLDRNMCYVGNIRVNKHIRYFVPFDLRCRNIENATRINIYRS